MVVSLQYDRFGCCIFRQRFAVDNRLAWTPSPFACRQLATHARYWPWRLLVDCPDRESRFFADAEPVVGKQVRTSTTTAVAVGISPDRSVSGTPALDADTPAISAVRK